MLLEVTPHASSLDAVREALASEAGIQLAYVFGSLARGDHHPGSDVDVAVLADHELEPLELGRLAERVAAALAGTRVDVVDLRRAPPLLAGEVAREGIAVIVRDPVQRLDFEVHALRRCEDTRHLRATQQWLLRETARGPSR